MGLVIYEIIFAFWKRINRFKNEKEKIIILTESEVNYSSEIEDSSIEINENSEKDVFQISEYIENDVDIVDYDNFSTDSTIFTSPNHFLYHTTLPYCTSLPNSPKSISLLNCRLSSPYLCGTDNSQYNIFDNIYNELAQLKKDLKEIKTRIKKFSRQHYVISTNIDNFNNTVEELHNSDYIQQLRELNEEENRSLNLEEKIKQLCQQLELCEDSRIAAISEVTFFLPTTSSEHPNLLSPSYLYDEDWSAKEVDINQNRWSFDFEL